jgi:hypothetical protein
MNIDLTKASLEELEQIKNEVLRHIALQVARTGPELAATGHDSHSSSHGKNSVTRFGDRVTFQESR